jgi:hypothetical protein
MQPPVEPDSRSDAPWMVTLVQTQLDEMAGVCNELHRAGREIKFIVPIAQAPERSKLERPTSHLAIFTLPKEAAK